MVKCIVVGIYNSGFQDFDAQYLIGNIRHLQRINKWKANQVGSFEVFLRFELFNEYDRMLTPRFF